MDNIRTKLDILSKIFVGVFVRSVNIVVVRCVNLYETKFESLYNDELNFLANKGCSYHSNYTMQDSKQVWNKDEGQKERDREQRERNITRKDRYRKEDRYVISNKLKKPKNFVGDFSEYMLFRIFGQVEWLENILKEMKEDL